MKERPATVRQFNESAAASFTRGYNDAATDESYCLLTPAECMKERESWLKGYETGWKVRLEKARESAVAEAYGKKAVHHG